MSQNEQHELPDTPRDRPILRPVRACKLCNLGMIGVLGIGPLAFGNECLFFVLGDVSFRVLPIILFPIAVGAAFMQNYLNRQIQLGTITSLVRFNLIVRLLVGFYALVFSNTPVVCVCEDAGCGVVLFRVRNSAFNAWLTVAHHLLVDAAQVPLVRPQIQAQRAGIADIAEGGRQRSRYHD